MTRGQIDANDGNPWSEMDLWDLKNSLAYGELIEEVAVFLCRSGATDEVRRKADELSLQYRSLGLEHRGERLPLRQSAGGAPTVFNFPGKKRSTNRRTKDWLS